MLHCSHCLDLFLIFPSDPPCSISVSPVSLSSDPAPFLSLVWSLFLKLCICVFSHEQDPPICFVLRTVSHIDYTQLSFFAFGFPPDPPDVHSRFFKQPFFSPILTPASCLCPAILPFSQAVCYFLSHACNSDCSLFKKDRRQQLLVFAGSEAALAFHHCGHRRFWARSPWKPICRWKQGFWFSHATFFSSLFIFSLHLPLPLCSWFFSPRHLAFLFLTLFQSKIRALSDLQLSYACSPTSLTSVSFSTPLNHQIFTFSITSLFFCFLLPLCLLRHPLSMASLRARTLSRKRHKYVPTIENLRDHCQNHLFLAFDKVTALYNPVYSVNIGNLQGSVPWNVHTRVSIILQLAGFSFLSSSSEIKVLY